MRTRLYSICAGVLLATYAGVALWTNTVNSGTRVRRALCDAWFCPVEFSPGRISDLHRASLQGRAPDAVAEFKRALEYNPASAYRWADLAESLANAGVSSAYAAESAVAAGPRSPAVLLRAGNLSFAAGDDERAMHLLRGVLEDPELVDYYPAVFVTYARMKAPIRDRLQSGMPCNRTVASAFLRFEMDGEDVHEVEAVWSWIVAHNLQDVNLASDYIRFLIGHNSASVAATTWADLNRESAPEYRRDNWVFNGGFELPPQPSPLDWQIIPSNNVAAGRVDTVSYRGKRAAVVQFSGEENVDFHGIHQQVLLTPGPWRIAAFVKTDAITTDQGIGLRIFDAVQSRRLDVRTETLTGTHDWTKLQQSFVVGYGTTLAEIEFFRQPSPRFDSRIAGRVWIDSVELIPERR